MTEQTTTATAFERTPAKQCGSCRFIRWNAYAGKGGVTSKARCQIRNSKVNPQMTICILYQSDLACLRHADRR